MGIISDMSVFNGSEIEPVVSSAVTAIMRDLQNGPDNEGIDYLATENVPFPPEYAPIDAARFVGRSFAQYLSSNKAVVAYCLITLISRLWTQLRPLLIVLFRPPNNIRISILFMLMRVKMPLMVV